MQERLYLHISFLSYLIHTHTQSAMFQLGQIRVHQTIFPQHCNILRAHNWEKKESLLSDENTVFIKIKMCAGCLGKNEKNSRAALKYAE